MTGGRPRVDDRRVLNGIVWKVRAGAAWRDVPACCGSWQSIYTRFRRWALNGTFERMLAGSQADADAAGDIDWLVSVDSTIVRAHQYAAGCSMIGCGSSVAITPTPSPSATTSHTSEGRLGIQTAPLPRSPSDQVRVLGPDHLRTLATRKNLAYWTGLGRMASVRDRHGSAVGDFVPDEVSRRLAFAE